MVGKTVGKYRVVERVGRGGMGIVYKAVDETLDRFVAIKVLNAEFGDASVLKRFRTEAVTLARLSHPGIATIYELHHQEDELMMVMEFVRGETLHQLTDRVGPLDPPQAAHLCMQVLDALSHAHRAGVIHRDLKPANLMVTDSGGIKVMDFGIARVLGTENYTHGGLTMGTPAYMSPEQVTGQPLDARSDLYAVGVVFYRLLSGRLPFQADTAIAMAQKQISEQPTPLVQIRPELPAWCGAIVERALAKDPAERFQTAEEFRIALASAVVPQSIGELPTLAAPVISAPATPTGVTRSTAAALESDAVALPRSSTGAERTSTTVVLGRHHLLALGALFIALAAGIVVLAVAAFRSAPTPPSPTPPEASQSTSEASPPTTSADTGTTPASEPAPPTAPVSRNKEEGSGLDTAQKPIAPAQPPPASTPKPVSGANPTSAETGERAAAPAPVEPAPALPAVAFGGVRLLVMDGERLRERRGVLRIADGEIVMTDEDSSRTLTSLGAITAIHYSRSRQPRWRDDAGKEVATRVDLGRFGFFRGDRNWLILATASDPVILSVDDPQLRLVSAAFETRTGLSIRRFQ